MPVPRRTEELLTEIRDLLRVLVSQSAGTYELSQSADPNSVEVTSDMVQAARRVLTRFYAKTGGGRWTGKQESAVLELMANGFTEDDLLAIVDRAWQVWGRADNPLLRNQYRAGYVFSTKVAPDLLRRKKTPTARPELGQQADAATGQAVASQLRQWLEAQS